jgi:3-oxoadipate enol-lactonase
VPYARVGDARLHYSIRGHGAPLLMLMGLGGSGAMWGDEFLAPLARRFRLILLDHRGTGESERGDAPYTIPQLAEDAAGVLAAARFAKAHVLGVSMGGMVAQELAIAHGSRVAALVLGCTTPGGRAAIWPRSDALAEVERQGLLGATAMVVTPEFLRRHPERLARLGLNALTRPTPPAVMREQFDAIGRFDASARLGRIAAPTLIVHGDRDLLIPVANARLLARGIRGAMGAIVKGTGHLFFLEAPERTAGAVTEFLAALPSPTTA